MATEDALLVVAGLLGAAAYLLVEEPASASGGNYPMSSGTGFAINNPGNIRYNAANQWLGQTGQSEGFCVFDTLANGVRALGILLTNYYTSGYQTITQIITRYEGGTANTDNNNIPAYIAAVSQQTGDSADEPLSWPQDEVSLIQAICQHETGNNTMSDSDVSGYIA